MVTCLFQPSAWGAWEQSIFFSRSLPLVCSTDWKIVIYWWSFKIEVRLSSFKKNCFYLYQWQHLKMMKNAFYFMWKAFLVYEIFTYLSWFLVILKSDLTTKLSNFLMSQIGQQIITIRMLPNISGSRGNQAIKVS